MLGIEKREGKSRPQRVRTFWGVRIYERGGINLPAISSNRLSPDEGEENRKEFIIVLVLGRPSIGRGSRAHPLIQFVRADSLSLPLYAHSARRTRPSGFLFLFSAKHSLFFSLA